MVRGQLAKVHHLPVRSDVVDAELVEDPPRSVVRQIVTSPRARAAGLHLAYVGGGVVVLVKRWANNRGRADRMARQAEQAGDREAVRYWHEQAEQARDRRHKRLMDRLEVPFRAVKVLGIGLGLTFGGLLGLGVVLWLAKVADPFDPILAFAGFIGFLWWAVTTFWIVGCVVTVAVVVFVLWRIGSQAEAAPTWLAPQTAVARVVDDQITSPRVVLALRELGIARLTKAIAAMEDPGWMLGSISIAGCGTEVSVTLPPGVSTEEVIKRRRKLAENLGRHEHEVYPTVSQEQARTVTIWAADRGALDEPVDPSPLTYDETVRADYKRRGAPWGVSLRGDPLTISLYQRHVLVVGLSNQGKTASCRALALWLALDKSVEFRIADLKGAGDWAMFDRIATVLIEGPTDDHVIAATEMLEDGVREMERRLASGGTWTPLILIVDEAQQAYACPAKDAAGRPYGGSKNTSRYLNAVRKIQNQGRAVDVVLWQGTQNPTNQNLPVLAREGAHLRICTAVGTEEQSRMALGDKAVDGGAAPHLLRAGLDKGMVVVAGDGAPLSDGQASVTVRTHYISTDDARVIARRALALRGPVTPLNPEEPRDLLQDVHEAFGGDDKVRASHLADRLRETGHRAYRAINGTQLVAQLAELGVIVEPGQGRHFPVVAARVLRAMDERNGVYQ